MRIVLAGAFGNLGMEILKKLEMTDNEIIAAGRTERKVPELKGRYIFKEIDVTKPETFKGLMDGCDMLISTVGLTGASKVQTCYDVDYKGNCALFAEAKRAGVRRIHYISVIACDHRDAAKVPILHAKYLAENELKKTGIPYVIYRPTGYFYDIAKVFLPYVEKGEMQLLKGYGGVKANVVDCPDFADFIVEHLSDANKTYEVGGRETYSYEEMAALCFEAAEKPLRIKYAPEFLFGILANLPKVRAAGKHDIILFSRFTLTHDLIGNDIAGNASFKKYIGAYVREKLGGKAK